MSLNKETNYNFIYPDMQMPLEFSHIRGKILDMTDSISHSTNTLGKGMNPIILPPATGK